MAPTSPALRQMLAEADAAHDGFDGHPWNSRALEDRFKALLAAVPAYELDALALEALERLPFALHRMARKAGQPTSFSLALHTVIDRARSFWCDPPPDCPEDSAIKACRALGNLHETAGTCDRMLLIEAGGFFMKLFDSRRELATGPDVAAALDRLLDRLGRHTHDMAQRGRLAQWIVERRGLKRTASATLIAVDADFARRDAVRAAIRLHAGPLLAAFIDAALDRPLISMSGTEFAAQPEVIALLGHGPERLGALLLALDRIGAVAFTEYPGWKWLTKHGGAYEIQPEEAGRGNNDDPFERMAGLMLRRRIDMSDCDMASLVIRLDRNDAYRSRHFLNHALRIARSAPDGPTAQALRKLAADRRSSMPREWVPDIAALSARDAAPAAPVPPRIDHEDDGAVETLEAHFANPLDARLHDAPHRDLLARLAALGQAEIEAAIRRHCQPPSPEDVALLHGAGADRSHDDARLARARQAIGRYEYEAHNWRSTVDWVQTTAAGLASQFAAVAPIVARHPDAATRLGGCAAMREARSAPTRTFLAEADAAAALLPPQDRLALLAALLRDAESGAGRPLANRHLVRGLIFLARNWDAAACGPMLADFALRHCYRSDPGSGIRDERLGNACLWTLIHLPGGAGVPLLARMLVRVKYPKVRAKIDTALNAAAAAAGIGRGELDELSVPAHPLEKDGTLRLPVGGGAAVLSVTGRRLALAWRSEADKPLKAPSAAMKADKPGMQAAKALAKEIEADLATQATRLQGLYLEDRDWPAAIWRQRYLEHPLLRALARTLIWTVEGPHGRTSALPADFTLRDAAGAPVDAEGARIRLWHPIEDRTESVAAWRARIAALEVQQPFAQAWRETYRVTDAERATATYSNRWAGHILKQHRFITLARLNGWTVTHRMNVDAPNDAPAHLLLPAHGLVADYWVAGAGEGRDAEMLASGAFAYLDTDRLMFSRVRNERDSAHGPERGIAVPIAAVPAIVLSEVMRHCDLFTAIASIAADPTWRDRGADAEHPSQWQRVANDYWERESFAELTEAARTRRALLETIVPRLAIAERCSFDERALIVRGQLHSYRIHIGSAAIAVLPQLRHLCIVPASEWDSGRIYLPFAGDRTLSIILSKAILLAADDRITDPVILRQL